VWVKETTKRLDPRARYLVKGLAGRLKKLRNEQGWTLEECEEHGFKNWRHLQEIETGKNITLETLVKVARLYNLHPSDLIKGL
jgi:transcriptional regulator with XRE-family HTH domain